MNKLRYNELSPEQRIMAEEQMMHLYWHWAENGAWEDEELYQFLCHNEDARINKLKDCTYTITPDGVVEVWI